MVSYRLRFAISNFRHENYTHGGLFLVRVSYICMSVRVKLWYLVPSLLLRKGGKPLYFGGDSILSFGVLTFPYFGEPSIDGFVSIEIILFYICHV